MPNLHIQDVRVGDLILLKSDEAVPADLVLLGSSNEEGSVHMSVSKA